jgi:hypothetical protein
MYGRRVTATDYENGLARLQSLIVWWQAEGAQNRNEATTRLHLIDSLVHGVLGWQKALVVAEERYAGKYADYSIGRPATRVILEAKREGIYFELPAGVGPGVMNLATLFTASAAFEEAARQVLTYCQERGVPIAVVTNGHQLVAFLASRQDGVPPLEGRALVFDSLSAIADEFKSVWDNLSPDGIDARRIHTTLGDEALSTPPAKLSGRIPDYPGFWVRNRIQTELKILADLVLEDIARAPELEEEFLRECYSSTNTLSEYALVSREILEARYSALTSIESEAVLTPARTGTSVSPNLTMDVAAGSLGRRPLILLGDVGVGKSMFIRHFMQIDARAVLERSIVLSVNFGGEATLTEDLRGYVLERFVEQLRDYDIDVEADKFVRGVYKADLRSFENSPAGRLKKTDPQEFERREIDLLERKVAARDRHLEQSMRYSSQTMKRQIIVFLDNIDQRDADIQEQVFLIGQSLAETWPATVFLSLRPDTFYRSRNVGSLTAYQPRVFTIAPPSIKQVIDKRLRFCAELVNNPAIRHELMPTALDQQAETLGTYLDIVARSFHQRPELVEFVDNLAGGNVREALGFLNTFVGSGHVNTRKILDIESADGNYVIPLHEFVRAIIFGDHEYFDPTASPVANLLEISTKDGREHFLLTLVLLHIERAGEVGRREGYVEIDEIMEFGQSLGYLPAQLDFALRHGVDKRLLQMGPRREDAATRRYRITSVGAYTYKKLLPTFIYMDAIVVDTPIVDDAVANTIAHCREVEDRLERARVFVSYLDQQWTLVQRPDLPFDWTQVSKQLESDFVRVERSASRQSRPRRTPPARQTPPRRNRSSRS